MVRPSGKHTSYTDSLGFDSVGRKRSPILVGLTVVAVLVFLTGLGLMIFGPLPEGKRASAAVTIDAGVVIEIDAAPPPDPTPPEGMILVKIPGKPALFVDAKPVSYGDFSKLFPKLKKPSKNKRTNARPVVSVRYRYAQDYANAVKRRLLTPEEWALAARTEGFEEAGDLWEWVDEGALGTQSDQSTMKPPNKLRRRRNAASKEVTFRLATPAK